MTTSVRGTDASAVPGARAADGGDPDDLRAVAPTGPRTGPADARRVAGCGWPSAVGASTPRVPGAGWGHGRRTTVLARSLPRALRTVPFTLGYTVVLLGTGLYARLGDPGTVRDLLAGSSTDVSHLSQRPLLTLLVSALWAVGGITSPYLAAFPLVLGALERRLGGVRTAGVFLLGHVLATLLTEVPVAVSVAAGHLPDSSLRRLDYGVSYGLIACAAALAGLLSPRRRWALLGGVGLALTAGILVDFDPLTGWGHGFALLLGVLSWPYVRRNTRWRPRSRRNDDAPPGFAHSERASGNTGTPSAH
ncbi:rhomboid-like protein [Streptomyces endocoffeicus]|uniref:rhomboid-like protein n=1 Tax=Streptomyces endocoffeicus TaxID=2898945 RepID=UPI001E33AD5F|nr:rhomboid-like protein [Streptomyces endocoffeicus]